MLSNYHDLDHNLPPYSFLSFGSIIPKSIADQEEIEMNQVLNSGF